MNANSYFDEYLMTKKGTQKDFKAEWGWWRYQVGGKMYAAYCCPGAQHKQYAGRELLTLKCQPELSPLLQGRYSAILPGFYMDKRNWISVCLEEVPQSVIAELCDASYRLVFAKLTKKQQREIEGE